MTNKDITPEDTELVAVESSKSIARDTGGRFAPGVSGNPSGRPRIPAEFTELAQDYASDALMTVVKIYKAPDTKNTDRIRAAEIIMDRAWGKPSQSSLLELDANVTNNSIVVTFSSPELDEWAK